MTKLLQKRFIMTAMTAISVLILFLLGAINVANIVSVKNDMNTRLHMISKRGANPSDFQGNQRDIPHFMDKIEPRLDGDKLQTSPFFTVAFDENKNIIFSDSSRIPSLTDEDIKYYVEKALSQNKESGEIGNYKYLLTQGANMKDSIVFLDTSDGFYSYIRVLVFSAVIGFVCWGIMLVFVIFLSKRAIKPIAENIEKQKQFVTNAGHEIKTPLAIIQTNAEALELYQGETKWSKNIKQQTVRLGNLMKNLLQLSKMDEGEVTIKSELFNLNQLLSKEIEQFEEMFVQNNLNVKTSLDESLVTVNGNKEQILQIISILLDNASKYAKNGTDVFVATEKVGPRTKISFENECDYLTAENPQQLFERFYRADKARTQANGGYGIGLSLAKAIAEANKYAIDCSYSANNKITFTILI